MNWDAFWDSITGLVDMPRTIIFKGWEVFERNNSKDASILKKLLNEYKEEYDSDFKVIYQ